MTPSVEGIVVQPHNGNGSLAGKRGVPQEPWISNVWVLWQHRGRLLRVAIISLAVSGIIAFLIPKQYKSTTRMMPPEQNGSSAMMLAALAGKAVPTGIGALAGSVLGMKDNGALFVDLLQSGSIEGRIVDHFELQTVYRKRYREDTFKKLASRTEITQDRKSGVITVSVIDTERQRARDMTQAYVDGLDELVNRVNTSAARREREFIEQRLATVQKQLEEAEVELGQYSSKNTTLDISAQSKAMVDAAAKLQAQLIVGRSELDSLSQIYGPSNVRVRAAGARVAELERELKKMSGSNNMSDHEDIEDKNGLYPPLRELPILGVHWADLYRRVKTQELVFELLTEEYETARIEEAKSIPTVRIIDPPSWPEKKSFPPRLIIMVVLTLFTLVCVCLYTIVSDRWQILPAIDSRKVLARNMWMSLRSDIGLPEPSHTPDGVADRG